MDNEEYFKLENVIRRHKAHLLELANMHATIRDMRDEFKDVTERYGDNGDTYLDADQVLIDFGSLLADLIVYTSEYEAELNKKSAATVAVDESNNTI